MFAHLHAKPPIHVHELRTIILNALEFNFMVSIREFQQFVRNKKNPFGFNTTLCLHLTRKQIARNNIVMS